MDGDRVLLTSGHDSFVLKGKNIEPLLNGIFAALLETSHTGSVIARLGAVYPEDAITGILAKLLNRRVLHPSLDAAFSEDAHNEKFTRYFYNFTHAPEKCFNKLRSARVALFGAGPLGGHVALALAGSGLGEISVCDRECLGEDEAAISPLYAGNASGKEKGASFVEYASRALPRTKWTAMADDALDAQHHTGFDYFIACAEKYDPQLFEKINILAVQTGKPFLWACLDGTKALVGPTVLPHETACFRCYETRVMSNADHPEELSALTDFLKQHGNSADFGYLLPHILTVSGIASLEVIKDLSYLTPPVTYNAQLEINLLTMEYELHPVLKVPRCPVCSRLVASGPPVRPFMEKAG